MEDGGVERHRSVAGGMGDMAQFWKDLTAAPDRGKSFYQAERQRFHLSALVEAGRHAGRSRVEYLGRNITYHLFTKDFFITMINQKTSTILLVVALVYIFTFFFFSIWWYLIIRFYPGCVYGATTYVESFTFAVVTHMTIGYGNTGPQNCWVAAWLIAIQIVIALLLESIVIGIVFARISHPKQRSRSIFISDSAIIARRDGILKFMFRVADIRRTQVVDPKIKAFMYTWGEGRVTAEGEQIPVRCEQLDLGYIDGMLLLPLTIEHTIDERSPLCGHTHDSLMALNAEVVVTFEGTTEFGNPFMARRSYLPTEIHWGHQFAQIIEKPEAGCESPKYNIDLNRFHDVLPQDGLPLLLPSQLSQLVVNRAKRTVPYPLLGENTLVLSDVLCIAPNAQGVPCLMCRAADTYPNQMLEITARMYLFRWSHAADGATFNQQALECGYRTGEDRLYLRLPVEVCHPITERSPVARWLQPGGLMEDADSEIVVMINCYLHVNGQNRLRQRTYTVHNHVRYGYKFQNIVKHPADSRDRKPRVRWAHFHDIAPLADDELGPLPARDDVGPQPTANHPMLPIYEKLPSIAPESHGALRAQEQRRQMWMHSSDKEAEGADQTTSASGSQEAAGAAQQQRGRVPAGLLRPPSQGRPGRPLPRPSYIPTAEEQRNDYTVLPIDLSRYAATAGNEGDSLPLGAALAGRRSALPTDFSKQLSAAARHQEDVEDGKAEPFVLFPEVAKYALGTTDAGDSLPHAHALHPTLPGPDSFRYEERNDYTVPAMDLSRYIAQVARSDTFTGRRTGPVTQGDASTMLAELQQAVQQQAAAEAAQQAAAEAAQQAAQQAQQPGSPQGASSSAGAAGAAGSAPGKASSTGESGYATPASPPGASPEAGMAPPQQAQQGKGAGTPTFGGFSPGAAAAAAALGAAAAAGRQEEQGEQQGAAGGRPDAEDAGDAASGASSSIGAPTPGDQNLGLADEAGGGEGEEGPRFSPAELEQLHRKLSRATSSWAVNEQDAEGKEEEEGSGPIHFSKQESWQRERALKNLFTSPDSPTAAGAEGGNGSGGPAAGGDGRGVADQGAS